MPAEFLYNLTKNLTAYLSHKLCAVLPYRHCGALKEEYNERIRNGENNSNIRIRKSAQTGRKVCGCNQHFYRQGVRGQGFVGVQLSDERRQ
ncbi:MAG: hypothetical protein E7497_01605 [Ruminococcus sp.]|nr:hypothetical protein [Ruminococcus sp.]